MARAMGLGALVLAAGVLAGCGSSHTAKPSATSATATPAGARVAPAASGPDPGTVGVRFTRALFGGHFDRARRYVASDSRNALLVITSGLRNASLSQHDLAAGSTRVRGTSAAVILTGTLCSSHSVKAVSSPSRDCITNRDPHSDNPAFRVAMTRGADRRWQVSYRLASMPGDSGSAPAPPAP